MLSMAEATTIMLEAAGRVDMKWYQYDFKKKNGINIVVGATVNNVGVACEAWFAFAGVAKCCVVVAMSGC